MALALLAVMGKVYEAAQMPIIKLRATKAPPELKLRKEHRWHMFLSHIALCKGVPVLSLPHPTLTYRVYTCGICGASCRLLASHGPAWTPEVVMIR